MLITLSMPQALLISGLPHLLRRHALAPSVGNSALRGAFSKLTNAWAVSLLFGASLYVRQLPALHDAALLNDEIHYTMHVTMLAAGLLFWWRIFDMRPSPAGLGYGVRLMMLWIATLSQIGLGAYLTLKTELLYPAYDIAGRLFWTVCRTMPMPFGGVIGRSRCWGSRKRTFFAMTSRSLDVLSVGSLSTGDGSAPPKTKEAAN